MLLAPLPVAADYFNFEAGQVRPLALSPDATQLYAVNTPDNRLAIFDVTDFGLTLAAEIPVGLRPVAVAVRDAGGGATEVWVVNHLSDSVSIVAIDSADASLSHVAKTLIVGDAPSDIVFGGTTGEFAFITTARRGQHDTVPAADFATAGTARALVWVFNSASAGAGIGGTPIEVIELLADTPRALAVSPDGATVYAASFRSGNGTTALSDAVVAGGKPSMPPGSTPGEPGTALIVRKLPGTGQWLDEDGTDWGASVPFDLPDFDVFEIDATTNPPTEQSQVSGVGATLFNMAVNPANGNLFVSNLEYRNEVRFVGFTGATQGLRGHFGENQITVVSGGSATPVLLNQHVNFSVPTGPPSEIAQSLAMPMDMLFDSAGNVYVAAFSSAKVGVLDASALEVGTISGHQIEVAGGPSGLALDETRDRLYVLSRFDQTVTVIENPADPDPGNRTVLGEIDLASPEPPVVRDGRPFLYDAVFSSGHGTLSCGSCHLFGDMDKLAWDLGDPFGAVAPNPNPFVIGSGGPAAIDFHPAKGPMTTQSLRGLPGNGPLHWRGDKTFAPDPMNVREGFEGFSEAFVGLLGLASEPPAGDFDQFADFTMTLLYPPNPVRALDDLPTADEAAGENLFTNVITTGGILTCNQCHLLPTGTSGESLDEVSAGIGPQAMKIPHIRNMYDKVGAYASGNPEVSGFGFIHDGTVLSMADFLAAGVFNLTPVQESQVEAFMNASDPGVKPVVGQQVSVTAANRNDADIIARITLMTDQADAGNCEVIVKGNQAGEPRGGVWAGGAFSMDKAGDPPMSASALRGAAAAADQEQVFTAVPLGTGTRSGIDRDEDGLLDGDDNCPGVANPGQADENSDGQGDACDDPDGDGLADGFDNCALWPNPGQGDANGNGIGNACECGDQTGDGHVNIQDIFGINDVIFGLATASPLCDTNEDTDCNLLDIFGVQDKIFGTPAFCSRNPSP